MHVGIRDVKRRGGRVFRWHNSHSHRLYLSCLILAWPTLSSMRNFVNTWESTFLNSSTKQCARGRNGEDYDALNNIDYISLSHNASNMIQPGL